MSNENEFKSLTTCCCEYRPYSQTYSTYDHERNGPKVWRKDYCRIGFGCRTLGNPTSTKEPK